MGKADKASGGCARHLTGGVKAGAGPGAGRGFRLPGASRGWLRNNGGFGAWVGGLALWLRAHLGLLLMALSAFLSRDMRDAAVVYVQEIFFPPFPKP